MKPLPQAGVLDSTFSLLHEGYDFISTRSQRLGADAFVTRLLFQRTICMRGEEAARLFYDTDLMQRTGAAPRRMRKVLVGEGGVQSLDGEDHLNRKQMFMSVMDRCSMFLLIELFKEAWMRELPAWTDSPRVVLFHAMEELLCEAVCAWVGVPLPAADKKRRTADLSAMIEGVGRVGVRYLRGRMARLRTEGWIIALVQEARRRGEGPHAGIVERISFHRNPDGNRLSARTAAVEVINLLRPVVAVARYITFAAHALHQHPDQALRLKTQDDAFKEYFVQEVRRYYPFFPFAAARVKKDFEWQGCSFKKGTRVLLDIHGTNHDPRLWTSPQSFDPDRFKTWNKSEFSLLAQGGGDHFLGHRCAGEWLTINIMKEAVEMLTTVIRYHVPEQDLTISVRKMPTLPESGFIITGVTINDISSDQVKSASLQRS